MTDEQRSIPLLENWRAHNRGEASIGAYEYPLFTDAWITGGTLVFGPYHLFNTIAHAGMNADSLKPQLVLRSEAHVEWKPPPMDKTATETYHGGKLSDEVAALVSLALGIRVKAGPSNREFPVGDPDPRGVPIVPRFRRTIPCASAR